MANHAYVIPPVMPSIERINEDAQAIVAKKFPQFKLLFNKEEESWVLDYKNDGYLGLVFWIGDVFDPESWNETTEECERKFPCIEFRHGHAYRFLWWVEYEIREELARLYKAKVMDDADGKLVNPELARYNNYRDYLVHGRELDEQLKYDINIALAFDADPPGCIPDEIMPLLGEKFGI